MKIIIKILFACLMLLIIACKHEMKEIAGIQFTKIHELNLTSYTDSVLTNMAACIGDSGEIHMVIPSKQLYMEINKKGFIYKEIFLSEKQYGKLQSPNNIQIFNNEIIISDFTTRLIVFYDKAMNIKNAFKLFRYPFKFKMAEHSIYYVSDYLDKGSDEEMHYGYKIFCQDIISNREK